MTPRRGRPPKPADEVRTVRVTVLLNDHEDATLSRACGGCGVATLLREAGLREAAAMAAPLRALPLHPSAPTLIHAAKRPLFVERVKREQIAMEIT